MNSRNINQAMLNRANLQYEYKTLNNRIDAVNDRINGVDIVFRKNPEITSAVLSNILSGTELKWLSADVINAATVYEAPASSSYINNLRPSGMWKIHAVNGKDEFMHDAYSPLESFVQNADGSVLFNPLQRQVQDPAGMNYGGNFPGIIARLLTTASQADYQSVLTTLNSNIESSEVLNLNSLYFIQNSDLISKNLGGRAESFTLHFE